MIIWFYVAGIFLTALPMVSVMFDNMVSYKISGVPDYVLKSGLWLITTLVSLAWPLFWLWLFLVICIYPFVKK